MNTKKVSALSMIILTVFIASSASKAFAATSVNVVASSPTIGLGELVTVNVTLTDIAAPGIFSYQLKLTYNNTLLNATAAQIPADHMLKPVSPSNIFIVEPGNINQTEGFVTFSLTLLGTEEGKTGSGTLVTVTFAGLLPGNSTVALPEADLILVDAALATITGYTINPTTIQVIPEFMIALLIAAFAIMSAATVVLKKKLK